VANTPSQIQPLRAYFQNKGINSLDYSELEENQQNQNSPDNPNKTNYLLIFGGVGILVLVLIFIYFFFKKNSN